MTPIETFLPYVLPYVPGCPDFTATLALRDAAAEFCQQTLVVRITTAPIPVADKVQTYSLPIPAHLEIAKIVKVSYGKENLHLASSSNGDIPESMIHPLMPGVAPYGTPTHAMMRDYGQLTLLPVPDKSQTDMLIARIAVKPSTSASELPDELFRDWREAIAAGALTRLAGMQGFPFTSPSVEADQRVVFSYWRNRARIEATTDKVQGAVTVRMNPLA